MTSQGQCMSPSLPIYKLLAWGEKEPPLSLGLTLGFYYHSFMKLNRKKKNSTLFQPFITRVILFLIAAYELTLLETILFQ